MELVIKEVTRKDLQAFTDLWCGLSTYNYNNMPTQHRKTTLEERLQNVREQAKKTFAESLSKGKPHIIIAWLDGKPVGYAMSFIFGQRGLIDHLFIVEDARGHGVGSALLTKAEQWLKHNNATEIEIKVFTWNTSAIKFYEKENFQSRYISMLRNIE